jgi:Rod binding domain-containing protein
MPNILSLSGSDAASWAAKQTIQRPLQDGEKITAAEAASRIKSSSADEAKAIRAKQAGQQFEAIYLRQMLDELMPKDSETLFGDGTSGMVWRSMLVDSLATTLAKSNTIGLAKMVVKADVSAPKDEVK